MHDAGQWNLADLDRLVDMVAHQAESVNAMPVTCCTFLQQELEAITVDVLEEYALPSVAAQRYMAYRLG